MDTRMTETNTYRAGFVAVVGRPNVGKSTLINRLIGQKIAITSPKPQTTRVNQLGILSMPGSQLVFVDTPGIHEPTHALGEHMVRAARQSLADADAVLMLMDASRLPCDEDRIVAEAVRTVKAPLLLGLNKLDLMGPDEYPTAAEVYGQLAPFARVIGFSAATGDGLDQLVSTLVSLVPVHEPYYDEEEVTQTNARDIAAELIREQVLRHTREEVPHAVAVIVDEFKERDDGHLYVAATIYVERDSQKGIVIGQGATMLKTIGSDARVEIEEMEGVPVYLELRVKVRKDWRKKDPSLYYPRR
jgi:GTP-binding protein Era